MGMDESTAMHQGKVPMLGIIIILQHCSM